MDALQRYQKAEQQHREKQRETVARQFKIVKQDATPEEIAAVVDDTGPGSNQIFAQAVGAIWLWLHVVDILAYRFLHRTDLAKQEQLNMTSKKDTKT